MCQSCSGQSTMGTNVDWVLGCFAHEAQKLETKGCVKLGNCEIHLQSPLPCVLRMS